MHLNKNKLKVKGTPPRPKKKKSCLFPTPLQQEGKMVKVSSEKPFTDQKNVHFNFPGFLFIHFFFFNFVWKKIFFFTFRRSHNCFCRGPCQAKKRGADHFNSNQILTTFVQQLKKKKNMEESLLVFLLPETNQWKFQGKTLLINDYSINEWQNKWGFESEMMRSFEGC